MVLLQTFSGNGMDLFRITVSLLRVLQILQIIFVEHPMRRPAGNNDRLLAPYGLVELGSHSGTRTLNQLPV
ncbi:hypothetical protein D1872_279340 [compost metagenome]